MWMKMSHRQELAFILCTRHSLPARHDVEWRRMLFYAHAVHYDAAHAPERLRTTDVTCLRDTPTTLTKESLNFQYDARNVHCDIMAVVGCHI